MPRIRRNPSGGYSYIRSLFQACYDNPLFQQEEAKFNLDGTLEKKPRSKDYAPADEIPEIKFKEKDEATKKRKLCIIGFIICCVAVIGFLVGYLISSAQRKDTTHPNDYATTTPTHVPLFSYQTDTFNGSLIIIAGPYSSYNTDYSEKQSIAYQYFSRTFLYQMSLIFTQSPYRSQFSSTTINEIRPENGQLTGVHFTIKLTSSINVYNWTESSLVSLLVSGFRSGVIGASPNSIKITALRKILPTTPPVVPGQCYEVNINQCKNHTAYSLTTLPNAFGHTTLLEVTASSSKYPEIFEDQCYGYAKDFWCSVYNPECKNGQPVLPCKQYCQDVKSACENTSFPLDCNSLPISNCRENPFKPGKCVDVPFGQYYNACIDLGFSQSAFPNYNLDINFPSHNMMLEVITYLQKTTQCYKHSQLFGCSVFVPKCSGTEVVFQHAIPPCRSLCEEYKKNCFVFWEIFASPWPQNLTCSSLPDVNDTSVCIGYQEAHEPPDIKECQPNQISCDTDRCIDVSFLCDGYSDCEDTTDEAQCASCSTAEYKCNPASNLCIQKSQVCNGISDCYEELEEAECIKLGNGSDSGVVQIYNHVTDNWEEVCAENWNDTFGEIVCQQLGYRGIKTTRFQTKSAVTAKLDLQNVNESANLHYLQSFLKKSASCAGDNVVNLACGDIICGTRPAHFSSPLRIVNGDQVKPGTWPSQVGLYGGRNMRYFCGGSILNQNWIVTAAHCLGGKSTIDDLTIVVGNTRRFAYNKYRQLKTASSLYVHEGYSSETMRNDIALIKLASPVYFNDYVRPMCLPVNTSAVGTRCFAVGWGKASEKAVDYEPVLRQVGLDVASWQGCKHAIATSGIPSPYELSKDMLCAGGSRGHDSCQGDSGGPLLCHQENESDTWYMAGLTSWGIRCALPNVPGIYTEVYKFIDWIRNITNSELPLPS